MPNSSWNKHHMKLELMVFGLGSKKTDYKMN
jgi:hypothetical protein